MCYIVNVLQSYAAASKVRFDCDLVLFSCLFSLSCAYERCLVCLGGWQACSWCRLLLFWFVRFFCLSFVLPIASPPGGHDLVAHTSCLRRGVFVSSPLCSSSSKRAYMMPTFSRFGILLRIRRPHEPSSRPPGRPSPGEVETGGYDSGRGKRKGPPRVEKRAAKRGKNSEPQSFDDAILSVLPIFMHSRRCTASLLTDANPTCSLYTWKYTYQVCKCHMYTAGAMGGG